MFLVLHRKFKTIFTLSKIIISDFWTPSTLTHTALSHCHTITLHRHTVPMPRPGRDVSHSHTGQGRGTEVVHGNLPHRMLANPMDKI